MSRKEMEAANSFETLSITRTVLLLLFVFSAPLARAQEWLTDFEQAKVQAAKENKEIILVFQGSDWCAPCIKLNQEIWSSDPFKSFAKDHFVMVKVDFPRKKANALPPEQQEKNARLAETYNKQGFFPFVVILDAAGNKIGETGYRKMTPEDYIEHLLSFK
jgi:thioredoxin-related protein